MKFFRKKMNKKGFTLIELIIVIAILGILAALAIPRFLGFTETAKINADDSYAKLVAESVIILAAQNEVTLVATSQIVLNGGDIVSADVTDITAPSGSSLDNATAATELTNIVNRINDLAPPQEGGAFQYFTTITVDFDENGTSTISWSPAHP